MGMLPITIRKRSITEAEIELIQATVSEYWHKGRTQISEILCKKWNWVQPNGRLKDMACREVLLTLKRKGFIRLPPRKNSAYNERRNRSIPVVQIEKNPLQGKPSQFSAFNASWPAVNPKSGLLVAERFDLLNLLTDLLNLLIRLAQARLILQDSYVPTRLRKSPVEQHLQSGGTGHRMRNRWRAQTVSSGKRC